MPDDAAIAKVLDDLCRAEQRAETQLNVTNELASEDDVDDARDDLVRASTERRTQVPQIGATLNEEGGTEAMRRVLDQVDPMFRATISNDWRGIGSWES